MSSPSSSRVAGSAAASPSPCPPVNWNRCLTTLSTPSTCSIRSAMRRRERPAEGAADDVVADEVLLDGVVDGRLGRGADDRHRAGEGEPDHQRRGSGGGAPRVAQRVLAGEVADRAEPAPVEPVHRVQQGSADHRAGRGDAEQDREHAGAGLLRAVRQRGEQARCPATITPTTTSTTPNQNRRCRELSGSAMSSRIAWTGAIREVRRAGSQAAATVTATPTAYAASDGARREHQRLSGQVQPEAAEQRPDAEGEQHPEAEADGRADGADHGRLDQHRPASPGAWTRRAPGAERARGCAGRPGSRTC